MYPGLAELAAIIELFRLNELLFHFWPDNKIVTMQNSEGQLALVRAMDADYIAVEIAKVLGAEPRDDIELPEPGALGHLFPDVVDDQTEERERPQF